MLVDLKKVMEIVGNDDYLIQALKDEFLEGKDLPNRDHLVVSQAEGKNILECRHCGEKYDLERHLPLPLNMATALIYAWGSDHQFCGEEENE